MNQKHKVLTELFEICQATGNWVFDNDLVKKISLKHKFGNPFDATKLDDTSKFHPNFLRVLQSIRSTTKLIKSAQYNLVQT